MGIRYSVDDVPPVGAGAFVPIPAAGRLASSWGVIEVTGFPGTLATPAPATHVTASGTNQPPPNTARGSDVSPDVRFSSIYIAHVENLGPGGEAIGLGMTRRRLAELPMPAANPLRLPDMSGTYQAGKLGGRRAMIWPRAFQRFT